MNRNILTLIFTQSSRKNCLDDTGFSGKWFLSPRSEIVDGSVLFKGWRCFHSVQLPTLWTWHLYILQANASRSVDFRPARNVWLTAMELCAISWTKMGTMCWSVKIEKCTTFVWFLFSKVLSVTNIDHSDLSHTDTLCWSVQVINKQIYCLTRYAVINNKN